MTASAGTWGCEKIVSCGVAHKQVNTMIFISYYRSCVPRYRKTYPVCNSSSDRPVQYGVALWVCFNIPMQLVDRRVHWVINLRDHKLIEYETRCMVELQTVADIKSAAHSGMGNALPVLRRRCSSDMIRARRFQQQAGMVPSPACCGKVDDVSLLLYHGRACSSSI